MQIVTAKEDAQALLETLPKTSTWDDIMYEMYVKQKIQKGLNELERGETISHEKIKEEFLVK